MFSELLLMTECLITFDNSADLPVITWAQAAFLKWKCKIDLLLKCHKCACMKTNTCIYLFSFIIKAHLYCHWTTLLQQYLQRCHFYLMLFWVVVTLKLSELVCQFVVCMSDGQKVLFATKRFSSSFNFHSARWVICPGCDWNFVNKACYFV